MINYLSTINILLNAAVQNMNDFFKISPCLKFIGLKISKRIAFKAKNWFLLIYPALNDADTGSFYQSSTILHS
ncbi:hypothetical protein BpHYR1_042071 [Brachionus plicatilis]|uniref:Uncharacterized protein n=1 Tax=Brachionus plicatilis TaxID=10195 RepID=A0A3M7SIN7_BRAPC|nr:hypothetical protein BpHYR1_042071 [Brachionus plicatilis]